MSTVGSLNLGNRRKSMAPGEWGQGGRLAGSGAMALGRSPAAGQAVAVGGVGEVGGRGGGFEGVSVRPH